MKRPLVGVALLVALCCAMLASSRLAAAAQLNWVAIGDSYSAGVGGAAMGQGPCDRDQEAAYSAQAERLLEGRGMAFSYLLAACSGATASDILNGQIATVGHADIVTMTIGGNDAGFSSWLKLCLASLSCPGSDSINWNDIYQRLIETYVRVREVMPAQGHLFVLTYPVFFANTTRWANRRCPGDADFTHLFAKRLNEAAVRLGDTIYLAIQTANKQVVASGRPGNIHFVDVRPRVVREYLDGRTRRIAYDPTGICSGVPDVLQTMNGLFSGRGDQLTDAFHPTNIGYFNMAVPLANLIQSIFAPSGTGGGGGGPGSGGGPTVPETTGGLTHAWTDYTDAGGSEGPTIPAYTTVQISCKLQGFQVSDGNTWWYRIGSDPWNDGYYASADAFYNNGQTSGSLQGTPFVDPNVPDC